MRGLEEKVGFSSNSETLKKEQKSTKKLSKLRKLF